MMLSPLFFHLLALAAGCQGCLTCCCLGRGVGAEARRLHPSVPAQRVGPGPEWGLRKEAPAAPCEQPSGPCCGFVGPGHFHLHGPLPPKKKNSFKLYLTTVLVWKQI